MPPTRRAVAERFAEKVEKTEGCWLWTASLRSTGYGQLNVDGKNVGAHRLAWEFAYGEIPEGMSICHRCDNRRCVRPDHLFLGTHADNNRDTHSKGRWRWVAPGQGRRRSGPPRKRGPKRRPAVERFWSRVAVGEAWDCWEWTGGIDAQGYGRISEGGRGSRVLKAHRVSWEIANGPVPEGLHILHSCDNRRCVNPAHLRPGTDADNMRDRMERGRNREQRGEANSNLKLTDEQVAEIRARYTGAWGQQSALALEFGVGQPQVWRIVNGLQRSSPTPE